MRHPLRQVLFVSLVFTLSLASLPSVFAINVDQLPGNVDPSIIADVSAVNNLIGQAQLDCTTNCPSWVATRGYLQEASNKTDTLLTFLDRQAKQILPELSTLAIAKNDFDRLVLSSGGKSKADCAVGMAMNYRFESYTYCFNSEQSVATFLTALAQYGTNRPTVAPTKSFLVQLNLLTDLSNTYSTLDRQLKSVAASITGCQLSSTDLRCLDSQKQTRITTTLPGGLPFSDTQNHWAREHITNLWRLNIVKGRTATLFYPDASITRAELMKVIVLATKNDVTSFVDRDTGFGDLPKSHELARYVTFGHLQGWINGQNGKFYPDRPVSAFEAFKIIFNAFNLVVDGADHSQLPGVLDGEQARYVETARAKGFTLSPTMTSFDPNQPISRGDVARVIDFFLELDS